MQLGF
jgi:hypothetical protein